MWVNLEQRGSRRERPLPLRHQVILWVQDAVRTELLVTSTLGAPWTSAQQGRGGRWGVAWPLDCGGIVSSSSMLCTGEAPGQPWGRLSGELVLRVPRGTRLYKDCPRTQAGSSWELLSCPGGTECPRWSGEAWGAPSVPTVQARHP